LSAHITRSSDGLLEVLTSGALDISDIHIHCTFKRDKSDKMLEKAIEKGFESGLSMLTFTNGEKLQKNKLTLIKNK